MESMEAFLGQMRLRSSSVDDDEEDEDAAADEELLLLLLLPSEVEMREGAEAEMHDAFGGGMRRQPPFVDVVVTGDIRTECCCWCRR